MFLKCKTLRSFHAKLSLHMKSVSRHTGKDDRRFNEFTEQDFKGNFNLLYPG